MRLRALVGPRGTGEASVTGGEASLRISNSGNPAAVMPMRYQILRALRSVVD